VYHQHRVDRLLNVVLNYFRAVEYLNLVAPALDVEYRSRVEESRETLRLECSTCDDYF
jgi:hypothetical protein